MNTRTKSAFHHFTVDVEEYFQVLALEPFVPRGKWDSIPSRLDIGVHSLLELLSEQDTLGTFFILGWIAERRPDLVRSIAERGHEIASHGSDHRRLGTLSHEEFRESVRSSKRILEDVTGRSVFGYRAPNFSIVRGAEWALEILVEEGYRYDSSLLPARRKAPAMSEASAIHTRSLWSRGRWRRFRPRRSSLGEPFLQREVERTFATCPTTSCTPL